MAEVTWELMRELAEFRSDDVSALSFYVRLDPSESPTPQSLSTRFNSLLTEVEKTYLDDGVEGGRKRAIRGAVERVREWAAKEFDRDGARGVAVFVSTNDDVWQVVRIPHPVEDHVEVDRQFSLVPLAPLVRAGDVFVAQVDRERGRVFRLEDARLVEVVDETEDVPGRHDQGGWSQARYRRHIEHLVKEHLKHVGGELADEVRRARAPQLVIVAPDELRGEIESKLSTEARGAIVGWTSAEPHMPPAALLEVVRPILDRVREAREREQLERWQERLGRNAGATQGWPETLEAASDARVELLLANTGARRVAYRCPSCLRASAEPGECPLDGTQLEEHDALDLALHQTLVHGGGVLSFGERRDGLESVGALLRF
jgi:peptide chain release factor subunit 1